MPRSVRMRRPPRRQWSGTVRLSWSASFTWRKKGRRRALFPSLGRRGALVLGPRGGIDLRQALAPRFLDQPVPVDLVAGGALGAGSADHVVEAAGPAAGAARAAAADPAPADIFERLGVIRPALVLRIVGVVAQPLGDAVALALRLAHADDDLVFAALLAGVVAV